MKDLEAHKIWDKIFGKEGKANLSWFTDTEIDCLERLLEHFGKNIYTDLDKEEKTLKVYVTKSNIREVIDIWLLIGAARRGSIDLAVREVERALKEQGVEDDPKE